MVGETQACGPGNAPRTNSGGKGALAAAPQSTIANARFRRQHSIDRFIVDFYCAEASLAIEVDGPIHQYSAEADQVRQEYLECLGLHVLRFTNDDVLHSMPAVLKAIRAALTDLPSP